MAESIGGASFDIGLNSQGFYSGVNYTIQGAQRLQSSLSGVASSVSQSAQRMVGSTQGAAGAMAGAYGQMAGGFYQMAGSTKAAAASVQNAAAQVNAAMGQMGAQAPAAGAAVQNAVAQVAGGMRQMAAQAPAAGAAVTNAMNQAAAAGNQAANRLSASTLRMIAMINRMGAQAGIPRSQYLEDRAKQMGIWNMPNIQASIAKIRQAEQATGNLGITAKQTAQAMRLLPAQFTDIFTSIASGMPLYLIAIQQGGQIKDSFQGWGNALKAVASLLTPFRLALGAVGVALIAVGYGIQQAMQQSRMFRDSLALMGNAAGTNLDAIRQMSVEVGKVVGSQREAAKVLNGLMSTNRIPTDMWARAAEVSIRMSRAFGTSVEDITKSMAEMFEKPVDGMMKLNQQIPFVTAEIYRQVRSLEEAGRMSDAARVAVTGFLDAADQKAQQATENLTRFERVIKNIRDTARGYIDDFLRLFNGPTIQQQLEKANADVQKYRSQAEAEVNKFGGEPLPQTRIDLAEAENRANHLREMISMGDRATAQQAERAELNRQEVAAEAAKADFLKEYSDLQVRITKEIERQKNLMTAGGKFPENWKPEYADMIREKMSPKAPKPKAITDSEADRLLETLQKREAAMRMELTLGQELSQSTKERIMFERQLLELATKKQLTEGDKSLIANQGAIRAQYALLEGLEKEVELRRTIRKQELEDQQRRIKAAQDFMALSESMASARRSREEQTEREFAGIGMSDRDRDQIRAQRSVFREFQRYQRDTDKRVFSGDLNADEYAEQSALIQRELQSALAAHYDYYNRVRQAEEDSTLGFGRALSNYLDQSRNIAGQMEAAWTDTFRGIEDVFADFVTKGKLDFQSLADTILGHLARIAIQAMMLKMFGGGKDTAGLDNLIGILSGATAGESASGGPIAAGRPMWVGETGRELFVPRTAGTIISHGQSEAGGKGLPPVIQYITIQTSGQQSAPERDQLQRLLREGVKQSMGSLQSRNSAVGR